MHSIYNLKHGVPKGVAPVFHNGLNYDYLFIIKGLAEELEGQLTCLGENTEKYKTFLAPIEKEVKRNGKSGDGITKIMCLTNLFITQDLRQAHYQILSIILLKEFIRLSVNTDMIQRVQLNTKIMRAVLNKQIFKDDFIVYKCLCFDKNYPNKLHENLNNQFGNTYKIFKHGIN